MSKSIPKFLHVNLKDTIGKMKRALFTRDEVISTEIVFEREWDESHTVERIITYRHTESIDIFRILDHSGRYEGWKQATDNLNLELAEDILDNAILAYQDDFNDNSIDYGDVVDEDDRDQEYQDTIDVRERAYVEPNNTAVRPVQREMLNYMNEHREVWYKHVIQWMCGLKLTPLSPSDEVHFLENARRNQQAELDEYGNAS